MNFYVNFHSAFLAFIQLFISMKTPAFLLLASLLVFSACTSSVEEVEPAPEEMPEEVVTVEEIEMEVEVEDEGIYTNDELGVSFELVEDWPQPEVMEVGASPYWQEVLGGEMLWQLGLGVLQADACEGTACYRYHMEEWDALNLDDVRASVEEDVLAQVISEEKIGEYDVLHTSAAGICGSLMSFVTDGERSFLFQVDCVVEWDSENQENVVSEGVLENLARVVRSLELSN